MTEPVERIVRETRICSLIGHAEKTHVFLVPEGLVSDSVVHDTERPPEVKLDRLVALLVGSDGKFAAGSFLQRPKVKPVTKRNEDRIEDFFTLSEPVEWASQRPSGPPDRLTRAWPVVHPG